MVEQDEFHHSPSWTVPWMTLQQTGDPKLPWKAAADLRRSLVHEALFADERGRASDLQRKKQWYRQVEKRSALAFWFVDLHLFLVQLLVRFQSRRTTHSDLVVDL